MKKSIGLITAAFTLLSSTVAADTALPPSLQEAISTAPAELTDTAPADTTSTDTPPAVSVDEQTPKQVGKAATDAASTAKSSQATKYILAAGAVAIGITALILVSRHHGHHPH